MLSKVWSHHARRSGYHPVAKGLGVSLPHNMRLVPSRVSRRIAGNGFDAAYQIALAMRVMRCDCLLVVDGDFQLNLIQCIRRLTSARIYAVFHQIPMVLQQCLPESLPLLLDGALCVARCQIPLVQFVVPTGKTWFVPHGVDADYFTPGGSRSDQPIVLCVGHYCRDFDTLRKSADLIARSMPNALVRLVAPGFALPPGLKLGRVELVSGLSDEQLREEYRRAWVLLLPLTNATANNALLESMACGTPVVVSDIGGVPDYASSQCGALCPSGDAQAHAAATIELLLDSLRREAAGRAARAWAENCSWPKVQTQIRIILKMGEPLGGAARGAEERQ